MPLLNLVILVFISLGDFAICFKSLNRNGIFSSFVKRYVPSESQTQLFPSISTHSSTRLNYVVTDPSITKSRDITIESKQQREQKQCIDDITIREADFHDISDIAAFRIQVFYPNVSELLFK